MRKAIFWLVLSCFIAFGVVGTQASGTPEMLGTADADSIVPLFAAFGEDTRE